MKVKTEKNNDGKRDRLRVSISSLFQSDLGEDEIIKVFEKYKISVFFNVGGIEIKKEKHYGYSEYQILNNLTTEEHFDDCFEEALQTLVKLKAGL